MKWLLLLGLLFVYGIWGQGLAKVEENRAVMEELLAQFERHERAVYWVAMASGMAQLTAGYNAGELDLRDTSGELAVVLVDGPRLRENDGRARLDLYDEEGETRASLYLDDKERPKFELD